MISDKCKLLFASFKVHLEFIEEPEALLIVEFSQPFVELAFFIPTLES